MRLVLVVLLLAGCGEGVIELAPVVEARDGGSAPDSGWAFEDPVAEEAPPPAGADAGPDAATVVAPAYTAASFTDVARDLPVYSATEVRGAHVVYEPESQRFVTVFGIHIGGGTHRTRALALREGAGLAAGTPVDVDTPASPSQNSLASNVAAGKGALLSVFESDVEDVGRRRSIYAQLLGVVNGEVVRRGVNFRIASNSFSDWDPCVGYDPSLDTFLVAWSDDRENGQRPDARVVYARTVSPSGALGPEWRLGEGESWQEGCAVEGGQGRFLVAWNGYWPQPNGALDVLYRARVVGPSGPSGAAFDLLHIDGSPDPVGLAATSKGWLVAMTRGVGSARHIAGARVGYDATVAASSLVFGQHPDGGAAPYLASNRVSDSALVAFHAMSSNDAFAQALDASGARVGPVVGLNVAPPSNGTYFTPVAASPSPSFLVVKSKNWLLLDATRFTPAASTTP